MKICVKIFSLPENCWIWSTKVVFVSTKVVLRIGIKVNGLKNHSIHPSAQQSFEGGRSEKYRLFFVSARRNKKKWNVRSNNKVLWCGFIIKFISGFRFRLLSGPPPTNHIGKSWMSNSMGGFEERGQRNGVWRSNQRDFKYLSLGFWLIGHLVWETPNWTKHRVQTHKKANFVFAFRPHHSPDSISPAKSFISPTRHVSAVQVTPPIACCFIPIKKQPQSNSQLFSAKFHNSLPSKPCYQAATRLRNVKQERNLLIPKQFWKLTCSIDSRVLRVFQQQPRALKLQLNINDVKRTELPREKTTGWRKIVLSSTFLKPPKRSSWEVSAYHGL